MRFVVTWLLVATHAAGYTSSQTIEGCIDPPWNNDVAAVITDALEDSRPKFSTGFPFLGIPPLEPLGPFGYLPFSVDTDSLRMDGSVNNTKMTNLSKFIICSLNFSLGITQKLDIDFRFENLHMDGNYIVDGLAFSLFPIFGDGNFIMNAHNVEFSGAAKIIYSPITDHASIKDLELDVFFTELELVMECILGCGDMADLINSLISDIAPPMFNAIWDAIDPVVTEAVEKGINNILKNISISDFIKPEKNVPHDLGNANGFMDLIMVEVDQAIISSGLDPSPLPDATLHLGQGKAELYGGKVSGLSTLHRDGTCTLDPVSGWIFLYANIAAEKLNVEFLANVTSVGDESTGVMIGASVNHVSVYLVARQDIYLHRTDIDQFIITDFGHIDVTTEGLGNLGFLANTLGDAVDNLVREDITNMLEGAIKDLIQNVLNETPWPY